MTGEPYYPVPHKKNQTLYKKYQEMALKEPNVTFVGRLANYKYFDMDQSVLNALELFDSNAPKVAIREMLSYTLLQVDLKRLCSYSLHFMIGCQPGHLCSTRVMR